MTPEAKNYTVMELAEAVGVPRTTINDWLAKYSAYVAFTSQGKRRVYPEKTLEMLNTVSALRARGISSFEIEAELAKRYAVHGEAVPPQEEPEKPPVEKTPDPVPDKVSPPSGVPVPSPLVPLLTEERFAVMTKETAEATLHGLDDRFKTVLDRMAELDADASKARRGAWLAYSAVMIMICVLAAGMYFAYNHLKAVRAEANEKFEALNTIKEETYALYRSDMDELKKTGAERGAELKDSVTGLGAETKALGESLKKIENGLPEQRRAFEKLVSDTRTSLEQALKQRDEAAAKREAASKAEYEKSVRSKDAEIAELSKKLAELEKLLEKERFAMKQLEDLKKQAAEAAKPEAAKQETVSEAKVTDTEKQAQNTQMTDK